MMKDNCLTSIKVNASKSYEVLVGQDILKNTGALISKVISKCKVAIITDDIVDALYSKVVENSLIESGYSVVKFVFKNGEKSKNIKTYSKILEFLAENQLTRTDLVIALGGGVVGDIAGFASATYLRGIKCVQIPTTLLSQIDSSVGGKTAIDLPSGKNLVGAFFQPSLVICDCKILSSLPKEQFDCGLGEMLKYAILDKNIYNYFAKDNFDLTKLVSLCIEYKKNIVELDEFESSVRKLLNLGHTMAHGIEKLSKYSISHGKAVALGLRIIIDNSLKHGYLAREEYDKIVLLTTKVLGEEQNIYPIKKLCKVSLSDKKRSGENITLVMVHGIGDCKLVKVNINELWGYLTWK